MTKSRAKPNKKMAQMLCFRLQPDNKAISAQVDSIFSQRKHSFFEAIIFYKKEVAEIDAETISFLWVSRVLKSVAKLATLNFYNFLLFFFGI